MPRRRRAHPEGELGHRSTWKFDLRRVMHFRSLRSFNDVTQEYSHSKEDGERVSKPTWGKSNVGTGRKINNRLRRTGKYATEITATARERISYSSACDSSIVDTEFCDGVAQDKTSARLRISGAGPPGSLLVSHTIPANTDLSSNTDLNKATHADIISSLGMNRVSKTASHVDLKREIFKQQNKQTIEKNETGLPGKPTHDSVGFDLAGGPCKPRSRLCRPKKRERRYLNSGVPQMGHGHGGGRSNRKPFPKKRLEAGRYNILLRRGQGTAPPPEKDLQGQLILNMRRVEHHNETRSAYDVEEVVDPEINDCFCEYSSQLKCLGERITKIPSRIVGNVTWFIVRMSSVQNLDVEVMAQYPSLRIMSLEENHLTSIPRGVFSHQNVLKHLYMSKNNIRNLYKDSCQGLRSLLTFFLDKNSLEVVELSCFAHTPALITLNLAYNSLSLQHQSFPPLPNLHHVFLHDNKITNIDNLFTNITSITTLQLNNNRIRTIHCQAFSTLKHLRSVDLSGNPLTAVQDIFTGLKALRVLNLMDLELKDIDERHFSEMDELKLAYFKSFRYCSYVPRVLQCLPSTDGVSNGRDMMGWVVLRAAVWVVAALTLAGNLAVIGCRAISKEDNKILKLFIKNLAAADLLMGVYLLILGVKDLKTRGSYRAEALAWASSFTCTFTGMLGLVSSETSVFILTFMSLERYLFIRQPLEARTLSERSARVCLFFIWLTSIFLAVFPAIWIKSFYESGAMCIPLHVTEPYLAGWQYSAFIFLGINTLSMAVILGAYAGLFFNIMVTRKSTPLSGGESKFALRFFFIVITNCVCWLPIACVKAAALANIEVHSGVYAWLVVLVLPINSAINPILYTFSTSKFQSQLSAVLIVFRTARNRQDSATDTDVLRYSSSRSWGSAAQYIVNHAHLPPPHAHNGSQNGPVTLPREKADRRASVNGFCKKRSIRDSSYVFKDPTAKDASSSNGKVSPEKDLSPGRYLTLRARVSQVRPSSAAERAGEIISTSPGSRGRLPLLKLELGGGLTLPSPEADRRDAKGEHTSSDGQEYKDTRLATHLLSHGNPQPKELTSPSKSQSQHPFTSATAPPRPQINKPPTSCV
ncbi:relaxin receptor 2-like [Penaeus chinensis]|uniref:relaxin receptor 2-like n=1 Tax=Penaeus chinensis TaxID=139456 RepID=UPI001FB7DC27|nr:relaxin receptor 2-like [Penaeus chinensis]